MIPCKDISFVEWTLKVRIFLALSVMESQKAAEDRQNKETPTDSRGFIVPQTQSASFPVLETNSHSWFLFKRNIIAV